MARPCCPPSLREEDRTHSIRIWAAYFDGDPGAPPVWEESDWLDIACSHNDAVAMAAAYAEAHDPYCHPVGKSGMTYRARDYEGGEGTKCVIEVVRGPAEEDYDQAREAHDAGQSEAWARAHSSPPMSPPFHRPVADVTTELV